MDMYILHKSILWNELHDTFSEDTAADHLELISKFLGLKTHQLVSYLNILTALVNDKPVFSDFLLKNKSLYKSLAGFTQRKLAIIKNIADYLMLPESVTQKIIVQKGLPETLSLVTSGFEVKLDDPFFWIKIGDIEGFRSLKVPVSRDRPSLCTTACKYGKLEMLKYLHSHNFLWDEWSANTAAQYGQIECLKYLCQQGCTINVWTCSYAAAGGRIDCLKYLHQRGCQWNTSTGINAVSSDSLECLRYFHQNGGEMCHKLSNYAAIYGSLRCLKYLHQNGFQCTEDTSRYATMYGQLECLKFLCQHGCPVAKMALTNASAYGHIECLEYLKSLKISD